MSASDFIQNEPNSYKFNVNLVAVYNPIIKSLHYKLPSKLTCLYCIITLNWNIHTINVTRKRGKSLEELISPSVLPQVQVECHFMLSKCKSKRCNIFQNYLICKNKFMCKATAKNMQWEVR